ncbi:ribosomal RNA-processing protein 7-domain-containing protein [Jimgerdemannia flammicorona]|uniref:Ribosomal RNA-processing protein 7-domain-containing protein n=1 Tax=Jimgerdemannia flammicorona TaxID=994334 RepID=A0A433AUE3_9FUNG|nr:ribosomal RNA-processing protein 7-domain-containing protein [Jimgerdemannia flammicorona]
MPKDSQKKKKPSEKTQDPTNDNALHQFSGFKLLPIHCPTTAFPEGYAIHYFYLKRHDARKEDPRTPKGRTLFLLNLPVDTTENHLRALFRPYGRVESVIFHDKKKTDDNNDNDGEDDMELEDRDQEEKNEEVSNKLSKKQRAAARKKKDAQIPDLPTEIRRVLPSGSYAHVVFLEEQELDKVLAMSRKKRVWGEGLETGEGGSKVPPLGFQKYLAIYNLSRPDPAVLQARVDSYMLKFTNREYEREKEALAKLNRMDDDGFVLVTRKGRRGINTDGTITVTAARADEVKNLKPKKKELVDFYRFQMREAKRDSKCLVVETGVVLVG